jgi:hypothetical protein
MSAFNVGINVILLILPPTAHGIVLPQGVSSTCCFSHGYTRTTASTTSGAWQWCPSLTGLNILSGAGPFLQARASGCLLPCQRIDVCWRGPPQTHHQTSNDLPVTHHRPTPDPPMTFHRPTRPTTDPPSIYPLLTPPLTHRQPT